MNLPLQLFGLLAFFFQAALQLLDSLFAIRELLGKLGPSY
jgi:hypothetical protein